MSSFKPKLYRSQDGCCICKAKSSSSRFTDSGKYEDDCLGCFKLESARIGEICNACVLIVKRWKKLPANTSKDWAHVVDARTGPGIKNVFRNKKRVEVNSPAVSPDKIKHKHVYKRKKRKTLTPVRTEEVGAELVCQKDTSYLLDFIDTSYWRRESVCCGVLYVGQLGEVMFDQRYFRRCQSGCHRRKNSEPSSLETSEVSGEVSGDNKDHDVENEEFYHLTEEAATNKHNVVNNNENETEETFYEKLESKMDTFNTVSLIASH